MGIKTVSDQWNSCFFKKINKIDKPLTTQRKRQRRSKEIRDVKRIIKTDTTEIQKIFRDYYEQQLYVNKFEDLEETPKFLDTCTLLILSHEETENMEP
jgi:hypothetical protein